MRLWQLMWKLEALMVALMVAGCSATAPAVRVGTGAQGQTLLFISRTAEVEPVQVPPQEVTHALQRMARQVRLSGSPRETVDRLFQLDALSGYYQFLERERKFVPLPGGTPLEGALTEQEDYWATRYTQWCRSEHRFNGDCLGGALVAGKYLDLRGRYMWAMAMSKSPLRGGPWTPRFEELFAKAGMRLTDAENIVPIRGHRGPHPERYHQVVFRRLQDALRDCSSIAECREDLTRELRTLAEEIATPGTELNQLVTLGQ